MQENDDAARLRNILGRVRTLAADYYRLTGKPLGVTGEIAEYVAADILGLELAPPRTEGYDAIRHGPGGAERIQIKGRAVTLPVKPGQRLGRIKRDSPCDIVMLVLLDNENLDPIEIWEAPYAIIEARLAQPGSKARNERGALAVSDFKRLGRKVWPTS